MQRQKLEALIIVVAVAVLIVGAVVVASYVMNSNLINVNVSDQETLTLDVSSTSIVLGESITLTATCSDSSFTGNVDFKADSSTIQTVAAVAGVASYVWTPSTAGSYDMTAQATHP